MGDETPRARIASVVRISCTNDTLKDGADKVRNAAILCCIFQLILHGALSQFGRE